MDQCATKKDYTESRVKVKSHHRTTLANASSPPSSSSSSSSPSSSSSSASNLPANNSLTNIDKLSVEKATVDNTVGKENHITTNKDQLERLCFECNCSLAKSQHLINIAGQAHKWHPECFKCNACNHPLDKETSCHIYKGKILCHADYDKVRRDHSTKCTNCHWPIAASDWVRRAGEHVYHLACFSCDICLRQLSTGEQFTISTNNHKKATVRLLCRLHFAIEPTNNHTNSTNQQATHTSSNQERAQDSPSSVSSNVPPFDFTYQQQQQNNLRQHQNDQTRPNQQQQHENRQNFLHSHQYLHLLTNGAELDQQSRMISEDNNNNNCRLDYDLGSVDTNSLNQHKQQLDSVECSSNELLQVDISQRQSHTVANNQKLNSAACGLATSSSSSSGSSSVGGNNVTDLISALPSKSKRIRTTFTEDQLAILQSHFNHDSNPDGQELEQIANKTLLSKRVTQVWFQNSRARQKKYAIKRKPSSSSTISHSAVAIGVDSGGHLHYQQLCGHESFGGETGNLSEQTMSSCGQGYSINRTTGTTNNNLGHQHQQHQHHHHHQQQQQHQGKWSNMSSNTELSVDEANDDENEDSRLTDDGAEENHSSMSDEESE